MIIPYAASLGREMIRMVPSSLKEAAYSLGATRYEVIRAVILPYAKSGLLAGVLLSLGRALGETMAVTMVIGNTSLIPKSIFDPGNTMASVIANEFTEAASTVYLSSLIELGLVLFLVTVVINLIGKRIIKRFTTDLIMKPNIKYRLGKSRFFKGMVILFSILCTVPLFLILVYILKEGITKINWHFLVNLPKPVGETGGGIANALVGSLLIVFFAALIAIPIGIMGGIYLSENKKSWLANWTRLAVDVLQGTPSIVVGIVIYFWIVKPLSTFSALSGSVALAIMMLPIVVRSTEETLKLLPDSLKEAGLALGLTLSKSNFKNHCALRI